jgi:hypothetical protein
MQNLRGTQTAKIRAKKAAEGRWKKHRAGKSLDDAVQELEEAMENLRRRLETVSAAADEPYDSLIQGCIDEVTRILSRKNNSSNP